MPSGAKFVPIRVSDSVVGICVSARNGLNTCAPMRIRNAKALVRTVCSRVSLIVLQFTERRIMASRKARKAPTPAASPAVKKPV